MHVGVDMKFLSRVSRGPLGVLIAFLASVALVLGGTGSAVASPGVGQAVRIKPTQSSAERGALKINDSLGYG